MNSRRRPESCLIAMAWMALAAGCLALTAALGAGAAMRRGALTGPNMDLRLGSLRVVAVTNQFPDCNPRLEGCEADFLHPHPALPHYYTVWVITHDKLIGPNGMQDQFGSQRLLKVQVGR